LEVRRPALRQARQKTAAYPLDGAAGALQEPTMKLPSSLLLLGMTLIARAEEPTTIVITPTGNETVIEQAPGSVILISGEEIQRRGYRSVAEALESVPGIAIVRSGSRGQITSLFARGANSNHTLVMRDGMVLNDPSSPTGAYDFSNMSLNGVERIEVVRGPLSTLYGSSAIGAVVNIISKSGSLVPRQELTLAAGNDRTFEAAFSTRGAVKDFRYQLSLSRQQSDGQTAVMQKPDYGNTGQAVEDDGFRNTDFNTRLTWYLNSATQLQLIGYFKQSGNAIDEFLYEDPDWQLRTREKGGQLQLVHRPVGDNWGMQLNLRHNDTERQSNNPRQLPTGNLIDTRYQGRHQSIEARFNSYAIEGHELSAIAGYRRDTLISSGFSAFGSDFGDFVIEENTDADSSSSSLVLQDQWSGTRNESITGSIRLEEYEDFGSVVSWRLAGNLPFARTQGRLHLSAGTGFKAPGLYELYGFSPNNFGSAYRGNPDLQPEKSTSIEAGIDYRFADTGISAGLTLYQTRIRDLIQIVYDPLFNSTSENLARAEIRGAEINLEYRPVERMSLNLEYSYTDARDSTTDERLPRRPGQKATLSVDFQVTQKVGLWLELEYYGDRVDISPVTYQNSTLDDYTLVNAGGTYAISHDTRLFAKVQNLGDTTYEPVAGYRGEGINGIVGLKITL
jgi:vitamin B12 transporter